MVFIVEMWDEPIKTDKNHHVIQKGRRFFSCHDSVWSEFQKLGIKYGWKPAGTIPGGLSWDSWVENGVFENDYDPVDYKYTKTVMSKDAEAWADALERALKHPGDILDASKKPKPILIVEDMNDADFVSANRSVSDDFIREFIVFLRSGSFGFTYDD